MTLSQIPETPAEPVTETIGGITFDDPYTWLEHDSERTLAWQAAQDAAARDHIHAWPGYEALSAQLMPYIVDSFMAAPQHYGDHWFALRFGTAGAELTVSERPTGDARVLVDVAAIEDERGSASLDWFYPSPDGRLVTYGISFNGDEQSILHIVEVSSGRVLHDRIPFMSAAILSWLPDSSGFWCNAGLAPDFENADKHLFFHRIGQGEQSPPESLEVREQYCVHPQVAEDGRWVAAITSEMDVRPDFVKRLPDGEWTPFLEGLGHYTYGAFVGDDYVAVSMLNAPRGRLVRIPVATGGDPSTWTELLPETDAVMRNVARAGDHLVLTQYRDAYAELRVLDLDGDAVAEVELPGRGTCLQLGSLGGHYQAATPNLGGLTVQPGRNEFTFIFSGPGRSQATYHYDIAQRRLEELTAPREVRDDLVVEERYATAPDGVRVHYTVIHRADLDTSVPQPTVLYGYGGWNIAFIPSALGVFTPFVDAGGVFVLTHLRGGGEGGEAFWHGGRLQDKQHTFDDLYAIAETVVDEGLTTREQLGVLGLSNGGLLTGAAVTQRPDLFGVVVSMVPLYDMVKFLRDPYTATCTLEYGDPRDPRAAAWLYAYSPYHNVREAAYPATLIFCGSNDMRCWPWQARKLAARLQAANTGDRPVLLRVVEDGGHLTVLAVPEQIAEWLGFLMRELGLEPAEAKA
jgi:prolyl oligopeptidase